MEMIRTFHPVGQGGFCTEQWRNRDGIVFTLAYDCGSQNKAPLYRAIETMVVDGTKIDVLVLSHLHDDHINGVEYLINHRYVNKIILPNVTIAEEAELLLYNLTKETFDIDNLRMYSTLIHNDAVLGVEIVRMAYTEGGDHTNTNSTEISTSLKSPDGQNIFKIWKYQLYYPKQCECDNSQNALLERLRSENIIVNNRIDYKKVEEYFADSEKKKNLIGIYESIYGKGNHNSYSMILYSGPCNNTNVIYSRRLHLYCYECCHRFVNIKLASCMYCGDANLKNDKVWNCFSNFFKRELPTLGIWQLPHHGSQNNYNRIMNETYRPKLNVVLASVDNKYNHPHSSILKQIVEDGGEIVWVCEQLISTLILKFKIN